MCLVYVSRSYIAKGNIPCYKALVRTYNGMLLSPFKSALYVLNQPQPLVKLNYNESFQEVYDGYHSFELEKDARYFCDFRNQRTYKHHIVVESYIPSGCKYYVGTFDGGTSFASSKIVPVKIIKG